MQSRTRKAMRTIFCYTFKMKIQTSAMSSVLALLISSILPSHSERHCNMYNVTSKSGDVYEVYHSVEVNDSQMSLCKRVNEADFMDQLCEESDRLFRRESDDLHFTQQWLQINLKVLMKHKRSEIGTRDTVRHSDGSIVFLQKPDEYANDAEALTFDLSVNWTPLVIRKWESVSRPKRKCVEALTSFIDLQLVRNVIVESSGSSVKLVLVCLATGFNNEEVQLEVRHNQRALPDEQLNSDEIRLKDGSHQLMKSLEILPSERSQYECVLDERISNQGRLPAPGGGFRDVFLYICIGISIPIAFFILLGFYQLGKYAKYRKDQHSLKNPSLMLLSGLDKTQMKPELLEEIKPEKHADSALNADSDDENTTDPSVKKVYSDEFHDTQSLPDTEVTLSAARGAIMGSKNISLPNFALESEDPDQNSITHNALLLPLPRRCRSKDFSLPDLV